MTALRRTLEAWLAAGTPAQQAHARWRLAILAGEPPAPRPPAEPARPTAAEALAALRSIESCPDRDPRTDCGCGGLATCRRGRGRDGGLVNQQDCLACLQETSAND